MGLAKPDPEFFRAILNATNFAPGQALFVDDKPQNVEAARSVGMHAECFANAKDGRAHFVLSKLFHGFQIRC